MTTRWTPGPWDYRRVLGDKTEWGVFEVGATNDDVSLCVMYEANARLISAAPDMAEALKLLFAWEESQPGPKAGMAYEKLRTAASAALKKAGVE